MFKYRRHVVTVIIGLFFAGIMLIPVAARADLPTPVPEECQPYVDERSEYFMQVISNYQHDLDFAIEQRDDAWEANERIAESAVARNWEYAALLRQHESMQYELDWTRQQLAQKRDRNRQLWAIIRDLRKKR